MPYINGKRVPMSEWRKLHPLRNPFTDDEEPIEDTPALPAEEGPPKKTRTKRQATKAAIAAATGVNATSLDEDDEDNDEPA